MKGFAQVLNIFFLSSSKRKKVGETEEEEVEPGAVTVSSCYFK